MSETAVEETAIKALGQCFERLSAIHYYLKELEERTDIPELSEQCSDTRRGAHVFGDVIKENFQNILRNSKWKLKG